MKIAVYSIAKSEALSAAAWCDSNADADYRLVVVDQASHDDTAGILHETGVHVINVDYGEMGGFRYDAARNYALAHLPDDIDLCISQDLDETLDDGFIAMIRAEWARAEFDSAMPWINTGPVGGTPAWSRTKRVHARHGYEWVSACHEVVVFTGEGTERVIESAASMTHRQLPKDRSNRIPLLQLAVEENPADARAWHYLSRDALAAGDMALALEAAEAMLALPSGWPAERAAACRYAHAASGAADNGWLLRGTVEGPGEAEAWYAQALWCHDNPVDGWAHDYRWTTCLAAARRGIGCMPASHYLTDQGVRSWGLADLAAIASYNLDDHDGAVTYGYWAWTQNQADGRLLDNLRCYVTAQPIPTYVVIPTIFSHRDELEKVIDDLTQQGAMVHVVSTPGWVTEKWVAGLKTVGTDAPARWNVLLLNDDVEIGPDFVTVMAAALRSAPDVGLVHPEPVIAGWCMGLRGEDGFTPDESMKHWYSDNDLHRQVEAAGKRLITCPASATHLHPNEATAASPLLRAQAKLDRLTFEAKWSRDKSDPRLVLMPGSAIAAGHPDIPWVTPITDTLWMGGVRDGLVVPACVKHMLTLCPPEHGQYTIQHSLNHRNEPFLDQIDTVIDRDHVIELAEWVNKSAEDGITLVHCAGGMNRSGLVVATALVLGGMAPQAAIEKLRSIRSGYVLFNPTFAAWVMALSESVS